MIPSRPLHLTEIIGETFAIYRRTFPRYALLFLLLIVPGGALLTYGISGVTEEALSNAQRTRTFDDNDLTQLRNDFRAIEEQNPLFLQQLRKDQSDSARAIVDSVHGNSSKVLISFSGN